MGTILNMVLSNVLTPSITALLNSQNISIVYVLYAISYMVSGGSYSCRRYKCNGRHDGIFCRTPYHQPFRKLSKNIPGIPASIEIFLAYNIDSLKRGLTMEDG